MDASRVLLVIVVGVGGSVRADVVTRRWGPPTDLRSVQTTISNEPSATTARVSILSGPQGPVLKFDLSDLPAGAKIYRADVIPGRAGPLLGSEDDAMRKVEVFQVMSSSAGRTTPYGRPLALRSPWFDRLDATDAVQQWAGGKRTSALLVSGCAKWSPEGTYLDVTYEGQAENLPSAVKNLKAMHRAGMTFLTRIISHTKGYRLLFFQFKKGDGGNFIPNLHPSPFL